MSSEQIKNLALALNSAVCRLRDKALLIFEDAVQGRDENGLNDMKQHLCNECVKLPAFTSLNFLNSNEDESKNLKLVISEIPEEYLMHLIEQMSKKMKSVPSPYYITLSFQVDLVILQCLIWFIIHKVKDPLSEIIDDLLNHFNEYILDDCGSDFYFRTIKLPVLDFIGFLVQVGLKSETMLVSVDYCFHWRDDTEIIDFNKFLFYFKMCLKVMDTMICHIPDFLSNHADKYANIMFYLVTQLMLGACHNDIAHLEDVKHEMRNCAEEVTKLLLIDLEALNSKVRSCYPYMIVEQYYTLKFVRPIDDIVKIRLMPGINKMLQLCDEEEKKKIANAITSYLCIMKPSTLYIDKKVSKQ